ncbi:hypothetical protein MUK42_26805 [Musa troglodytarum]|uniref:Uncharacterized protein n=1 Tax=Musa troglodytarum TaxID=320322 RepID=A0A9E7K9U9_9LILI|nr:hypothetical protein MUK42_26805 [Musa troglodytarum]
MFTLVDSLFALVPNPCSNPRFPGPLFAFLPEARSINHRGTPFCSLRHRSRSRNLFIGPFPRSSSRRIVIV